jgi:preprotein translocase subunit SecF
MTTDVLSSNRPNADVPVSQTPPAQTPVTPATTPSLNPVALAVACVALAGFGALIVYMFSKLGLQEPAWSRAVYLLNGVEAVAFAAAGFLFGREVNRGRAENAEIRANQAENTAKEKEQEAKNLAAAVVENATDTGDMGVQMQAGSAQLSPRVTRLALDVLSRSR